MKRGQVWQNFQTISSRSPHEEAISEALLFQEVPNAALLCSVKTH